MFGKNDAGSGEAIGVLGSTDSPAGRGVGGFCSSSTGDVIGVQGQVKSPDGAGVFWAVAAESPQRSATIPSATLSLAAIEVTFI